MSCSCSSSFTLRLKIWTHSQPGLYALYDNEQHVRDMHIDCVAPSHAACATLTNASNDKPPTIIIIFPLRGWRTMHSIVHLL